jgi:rhodanese-related sulfurtransferase
LKGHIAGSAHIPLDELRDRASELPSELPLIILSTAGFEGHLALRQLAQLGFKDLRYVTGGMTSMRLVGSFEELQGD